jgi:DNA repair protein RAD5
LSPAIGRIHRAGLKKPVFFTHFMASALIVCSTNQRTDPMHTDGTIENRILQIQQRKTAIVKEIFRGDSGFKGNSIESIKNTRLMLG